MAHKPRNTWNCGGGGGGGGGESGGGGYSHKFVSRIDFRLIVYCLETAKFVDTTKWLQLSGYN